jgi:hypothetical protein
MMADAATATTATVMLTRVLMKLSASPRSQKIASTTGPVGFAADASADDGRSVPACHVTGGLELNPPL